MYISSNSQVGLLPSAVSRDYLEGTLKPSKTLQFYFNKVDEAVERAIAGTGSDPNTEIEINIIAHSIGGNVNLLRRLLSIFFLHLFRRYFQYRWTVTYSSFVIQRLYKIIAQAFIQIQYKYEYIKRVWM